MAQPSVGVGTICWFSGIAGRMAQHWLGWGPSVGLGG